MATDYAFLLCVLKTTKSSSRLIKWALRLQEFTFTMEYRKGKYNTVPNALFRAPIEGQTTSPVCAILLSASPGPSKQLPIFIKATWRAERKSLNTRPYMKSWKLEGCHKLNHFLHHNGGCPPLCCHTILQNYLPTLHTCGFQGATTGVFPSIPPFWSSLEA